MIDVQTSAVTFALEMVNAAISGPSLAAFAYGPLSEYLEGDIINRFSQAEGISTWPPLRPSTIRIRHGVGQFDDDAINERTGEMLRHLLTSKTITTLLDQASVTIPGPTSGETLRKIETAQMGRIQGPDDLMPGAITPPRPVLGLDERDAVAILALLAKHIETMVAGDWAFI